MPFTERSEGESPEGRPTDAQPGGAYEVAPQASDGFDPARFGRHYRSSIRWDTVLTGGRTDQVKAINPLRSDGRSTRTPTSWLHGIRSGVTGVRSLQRPCPTIPRMRYALRFDAAGLGLSPHLAEIRRPRAPNASEFVRAVTAQRFMHARPFVKH